MSSGATSAACRPIDPDSNYKLAYDALLSKVPIPETNIHRVPTESGDCVGAAADYAQELVTFFGLEGRALPHFDLLLLGVGDDGHTASLFPGKPALDERDALVVATPPGRLPPPVRPGDADLAGAERGGARRLPGNRARAKPTIVHAHPGRRWPRPRGAAPRPARAPRRRRADLDCRQAAAGESWHRGVKRET